MQASTFAADVQPRLVRHARCELSRLGLSAEGAEDVVQDAWSRWLAHEPVYLEAWLRTCIHRLAIDASRRRAGMRRGDPLDMEPVSLDAFGA